MDTPKHPVHAEAGVIIGGYELVRRIGRGGMAEVWVARRALGRKGSKFVAIKLIADHYIGDERYGRMFRAEAELAAVLSHANIVQVFDEGEEDGRSYLIMEWVDGLNLLKLGAVLALLDDNERRFRVASYIIGQLLYALKYAHSITSFDGSPLGIVHRDVSPQNVLVSNHGEVKLTDFGVAYYAMEESSGLHVKGKVRYMSPEQISGKTRSPTVDLYAVGALLHELLDGKKFRADYEDGQEMFTAVLAGTVPPLTRRVPAELDELRVRLLQPDPADRIQSAEEAIEWLKLYPGYGDARDELTKLCSSLTGVVRPRVGPGRSSQVPAAPKNLAKPRVNLGPARGPQPPPPPGARTSSTTAIKSPSRSAPQVPVITGDTQFVDPYAVGPVATRFGSAAPALPPAPHYVPPQPSSPIPYPVAAQSSHPIPIPIAVGAPGLVVAPTERLGRSETSGPPLAPTELVDSNLLVELGVGSGTDQEILPPIALREGTDTSRDIRPRTPTHSHTISIALPKSSHMALIGLVLVVVALASVGVTWWLFTQGRGEPDEPADAAQVHPDEAAAEPGQAKPGAEPAARPSAVEDPVGSPAVDGEELEPAPASPDPTPDEEPAADEPEIGLEADVAAESSPPVELATDPEPTVPEDPRPKAKKGLLVVKALPGMEGAQIKVGSQVMTIPPISRTAKKRLPAGLLKVSWRAKEGAPWTPAPSVSLKSGRETKLVLSSKGPKET